MISYRFCLRCSDLTFLRDKKRIDVAFLQSSTKSTQVELVLIIFNICVLATLLVVICY